MITNNAWTHILVILEQLENCWIENHITFISKDPLTKYVIKILKLYCNYIQSKIQIKTKQIPHKYVFLDSWIPNYLNIKFQISSKWIHKTYNI